ncbi:phosphopantetheine-binding protein [Xanthomonas arboricola pv. corylina]|nr:phosphopantetheine-binding protein [Xanthomonas arboricola pv. corylina]
MDAHASLIQLGMDSMHLMAWLNRLRQRGHKVTLRELYAEPTSAGWSRLLRHKTAAAHAPTAAPSAWPQMRDGEAFELTPVQHAYLVGRSPNRRSAGSVVTSTRNSMAPVCATRRWNRRCRR